MTILDDAVAYASAGYRVVPLYPILTDPETGARYCSCRLGPDCGSAGKHPHSALAPKGVYSWTTNVDEIRAWPEDINIGFCLTDTFCAIDIDDPAVWEKLLADEIALHDTAFAAVSGKGGHIYGLFAPTAFGNLYDGHKRIGEVRSNDALIVAPPSLHWMGTRYRWLGRSILEGPPLYPGTAWDYARSLLADVGIVAQGRKAHDVGPIDYVAVPAVSLPFEIPSDAMTLRQFMSGTYPTNDRSDSLYRLACEVWRVSYVVSCVMTPLEVAGVLRTVDAVSWRKFTRRGDSDKRYLDIAHRSKMDVAPELATLDALPAPGTDPGVVDLTGDAVALESIPVQPYAFDPVSGFVYRAKRGPDKVANFEPTLTEVLEVWDGSGEISEDWVLSLRLNGLERVARLRPSDRRSIPAFRARLSDSLPPEFIVEPHHWEMLEAGIKEYSKEKFDRRRAYAATGWLDGVDAFLLPGLDGVITPDGIDTSIVFEDPEAPDRLRQYGIGLRPATVPLAETLSALYATAEPPIIVPLMAQFLGAPLASLGIGRAIVHLFAKTGSLKTSLARTALSIYGDFGGESDGKIDSWTGTKNSLQATAHRIRDLPLLLDDYKESSLRRDELSQVTGFIQNYADGTVRTRMGRDQREQKHLIPRCLIVSTGEDLWDKQQSSLARTVVIDVPPQSVYSSALRIAQKAAADGTLAEIGYAWLTYLTRLGQESLRQRIPLLRLEKWDEAASTALGKQHLRVQSAIASLLAVDQLFQEFLAVAAPDFVAPYLALRKPGWDSLVENVVARADDARSLSPYAVLQGAVLEGMEAGQICLGPRMKGDDIVGMPGAEIIGWVDHAHVYLTENMTFGWFKQRRQRQGETAGFSWQAFTQEARQQHRATRPLNPTSMYDHGVVRCWMIPREEFLVGMDDEDAVDPSPEVLILN